MTLLRLKQIALGADRYRAELEFSAPGQATMSAAAEFKFDLSEQEERDLRWYMEDYLQNPHEPAPTIAKRIEARMAEIGGKLFTDVFEANAPMTRLWACISDKLDDLRVEVNTTVRDATAIPWELLRDPVTDTLLALTARAFVRAQENERHIDLPQAAPGEAIRILLVIARPNQGEDVPFRSVAARILKGLTDADKQVYQLDVLRPATFTALALRLEDAKAAGKPYHVVHFDGHGTYAGDVSGGMPHGALMFSGAGKRGYLIFEGENDADRWIDGKQIGDLLVRTDVPVLLLNACQSAYAEAPEQPPTEAPADIHAEVRAFGSLAQQVMDAGTAGVVAMRYSVYVVTAAQFVAELYRTLISGVSLGEAVTRGRKNLHADPSRKIGFKPIPLQDWSVPLVYEAAPITLFPKQTQTQTIAVSLSEAAGKGQDSLPKPPDVGFFGRDETLLALDRGFDRHNIALLWALAGSGKTTTAAEFARWYADTGGLGQQFALLFTTFERHKPLVRALDDFADSFQQVLDAKGILWSALELPQRRMIALQIMKQIPVFWIWDNVEPVAGFPVGTQSAWSADEQRELVDFLRDTNKSKAKFLLTSRRDEDAWLGQVPFRVQMPPMPLRERVDLAAALAQRRSVRDFDAEVWRPLLRYTQGNPLTITVLVDQALKHNLRTREQVEDFVAKLRAGETAIEDMDEAQGRGVSLAASLKYGFEAGFGDAAKAVLALLYLFQGFVDVNALQYMGFSDEEWTIEALRGKTSDDLLPLLHRAAEAGLLTAVGRGYYTIHPALPWYFTRLFEANYGKADARLRVERAYVEAVGYWGNYYKKQADNGNPKVLELLAAEEDNLLAARSLALANDWHNGIIQTMQGLRNLYERTGRNGEWAALVEEIVPVFCDPATDLQRAGVDEGDWVMITEYRVHLARQVRDLSTAERLQRTHVEVSRHRAAPVLTDELSAEVRHHLILMLAVSIETLAHIQREGGDGACVTSYEEAEQLYQHIGDRNAEGIAAFNLGHAYLQVPAIRNLDKAAEQYQRCLNLRDKEDMRGRATCLGQLGRVAYERFKAVQATGVAEAEYLKHINEALRYSQKALALLPPNAVPDLAIVHNELGNIYKSAGQTPEARKHYDASIRYEEMQSNLYGAAQTRNNVAIMYAQRGELATALLYAEAALRGFQDSPNAADKIQRAQRLVLQIKHDMQGGTA